FGFEAARSAYMRLAAFDAESANRVIAALTEEARAFARQGMAGGEPRIEQAAYMRYAGQGWEIPVETEPGRPLGGDDAADLRERFEQAYRRFFGRPIEGLDAEIVSWSVRASSPRPPAARVTPANPAR